MKRKTKLGSLLDLTTLSFNSLGYADWSTSDQSFQKVKKTEKKAFNNNEKKVKD